MSGRWRRVSCLLAALLLPVGGAAAEPLLLVAHGSGGGTVYLFGTMHMLPRRAVWFTPRVRAAFGRSTALWEEADIGLTDPQAMLAIMLQGVTADDLFARLPPAYAATFRRQLRGCGIPVLAVAHMQPWLAATVPALCVMSDGPGRAPVMGPEATLLRAAQDAGKQVGFFETAAAQLALLAGGSPRAGIARLEQAIDEGDAAGGDQLDRMEAAWLAGAAPALAGEIDKMRHDDPEMYRTLFVKRNVRFAARIRQMLRGGGTVFVAIGAGHLVGAEGVPALLRRAGVTVAAVPGR